MGRIFDNAGLSGSRAQVLLLIVALAPISMQGQTSALPVAGAAAPPPAFEAASIRPEAQAPEILGPSLCLVGCDKFERFRMDGSRVDIRYSTLFDLISRAYRLKRYQLSNVNPKTISKLYWDWMGSQRFEIAATIPEGVSASQVPEMLQQLLAQRFKLSLHFATRDRPVYALVVEKNGPKLRKALADADAPVPDTPGSSRIETPVGEARVDKEGYAIGSGPYGPIRVYVDKDKINIHTDFLKVTMSQLVDLLDQDRPVMDKTNLKGYYQFSIVRLSPVAAREAGGQPPLPWEPARDALAKAGLRLVPTTAPFDVVVIDHLEKSPTEN
jgi:uncharacterized protein (TIGR03435 family)